MSTIWLGVFSVSIPLALEMHSEHKQTKFIFVFRKLMEQLKIITKHVNLDAFSKTFDIAILSILHKFRIYNILYYYSVCVHVYVYICMDVYMYKCIHV